MNLEPLWHSANDLAVRLGDIECSRRAAARALGGRAPVSCFEHERERHGAALLDYQLRAGDLHPAFAGLCSACLAYWCATVAVEQIESIRHARGEL